MEYTRYFLENKIKNLNDLIEKCIINVKLGIIDVEKALQDVNCFVELKLFYVEKLKKLDNKLSKN